MDPAWKSTYVLEMSIAPGIARLGLAFAYPHIEPIQRVLEFEFLNEDPGHRGNAFDMACQYKEFLLIWVVQNGHVEKALNLRPLIEVKIGGRPPVALSECAGQSALIDEAISGADIRFSIAWRALTAELPPLTGELLQAGEHLTLRSFDESLVRVYRDTYVAEWRGLDYGFNDMESGEVTWWIDPEHE